jgi:hypothetical protein
MNLWEQMVTEERRRLASSLGLRVSDVEEQQALLTSLQESKGEEDDPDRSEVAHPERLLSTINESGEEAMGVDEEGEEDVAVEYSSSLCHTKEPLNHYHTLSISITAHNAVSSSSSSTAAASAEVEEGGSWHLLPQVLVDHILTLLGDPDMCGLLHCTSRRTFQASENVYRFLCEITYPRQTTKKTCRMENWRSWRNMCVMRPRLRTNGFYTLRTMFSKAHCNDEFWEEKRYESIEVKYYRHMRFFDHGKVLYALDITEPEDMVRVFAAAAPVPKRVFVGTYTLVKNRLRVEVRALVLVTVVLY